MEMVVLGTSETISDLLDKRSAIYSDKARLTLPTHQVASLNVPAPAIYSNDRVVRLLDRSSSIDLIYSA